MKHLKYYPIFEASKQNWGEKYSDLVLGFSEKVKEENCIDIEEIKDICISVLDDFKNYDSPELDIYLNIIKNWPKYPESGYWDLPYATRKIAVHRIASSGVYSLFTQASAALKNLIEKNMNLYFQIYITIESLPGGSNATEQKKIFRFLKEAFKLRDWDILKITGTDYVTYRKNRIEFDIIKPVTYELAKSWLEQNRHLLSKD